MLYVGVAALFLILADFSEFIIEGIVSKNHFKLEKTFEILRYIALACAIIFIIVLPNMKIDIPIKRVNALSDSVTLAGLGIAITLIGLKHERMQKRFVLNTREND